MSLKPFLLFFVALSAIVSTIAHKHHKHNGHSKFAPGSQKEFLMTEIDNVGDRSDIEVYVSDGNDKIITSTGLFIVNGELLGSDGIWLNRKKFTVYVAAWKGWWVGKIIFNNKDNVRGMKTMFIPSIDKTDNPHNDVFIKQPSHFEAGNLYFKTLSKTPGQPEEEEEEEVAIEELQRLGCPKNDKKRNHKRNNKRNNKGKNKNKNKNKKNKNKNNKQCDEDVGEEVDSHGHTHYHGHHGHHGDRHGHGGPRCGCCGIILFSIFVALFGCVTLIVLGPNNVLPLELLSQIPLINIKIDCENGKIKINWKHPKHDTSKKELKKQVPVLDDEDDKQDDTYSDDVGIEAVDSVKEEAVVPVETNDDVDDIIDNDDEDDDDVVDMDIEDTIDDDEDDQVPVMTFEDDDTYTDDDTVEDMYDDMDEQVLHHMQVAPAAVAVAEPNIYPDDLSAYDEDEALRQAIERSLQD